MNNKQSILEKTLISLFWVIGIVLIMKRLLFPIANPDLWWHLSAGGVMAEGHKFLRADIFSHTLQGYPWVNFEWISQILFYKLFAYWGLTGIYVFKIIACIFILLLLFKLIFDTKIRGAPLFALLFLGYEVLNPRLHERPELWSFLFLTIFIFICLKNRTKDFSWTYPLVLGAIMLLWVNMHGGFIFGFGVLFSFGLGSIWDQSNQKKFYGFSFLICLLMSFINPYGPKIYLIFLEHARQFKTGSQLIYEWRSPSIIDAPHFWALFLISSLTAIIGFFKRWQGIKFWLPAVILFSIWGSLYFRNTALLAFIAVPFLGEIFSQLKLDEKKAFILIPIILLGLEYKAFGEKWPSQILLNFNTPQKACTFVKEQNLQGNLYNTYDLGGYLGWDLFPERKIFVDGRYIFYPVIENEEEMLNETTFEHNPWSAYFKKLKIEYAVVGRNPTIFLYKDLKKSGEDIKRISAYAFMFPHKEWALVFRDDQAEIYVRRNSQNKNVISRFELKDKLEDLKNN